LDIFIAVIGFAVSAFLGFGFFKAGKFKLTASRETLLGAGFGWVEKTSMGAVRTLALLEVLGAIGGVVAPAAFYMLPGFEWAIWFGVAATAGLALVMVAAIILHQVRGESKYTLKMNLGLLLPALVATGLWIYVAIA
jgi:hypothetical protein